MTMSKLYLMTKEDMRVELLKLIQEGIDLNPIGTIISFMGQQPPTTYLRCDGGQYVIADYQELADFIVVNFGVVNHFGGDGERYFAVPDLRGEFLRGTGANGRVSLFGITQGSGASVGAHQDATELPALQGGYNNTIYMHKQTIANGNTENNVIRLNDAGTQTYTQRLTINPSSLNTINDCYFPSRVTTRPTNTSVLFCIKAKNG